MPLNFTSAQGRNFCQMSIKRCFLIYEEIWESIQLPSLFIHLLETLRNDNTTATQRNEQKGDPPLISQITF